MLRRPLVIASCGLALFIGAFTLGWQMALATQDKPIMNQPGKAAPVAPLAPISAPKEPIEKPRRATSHAAVPSAKHESLLETLEAQVRDHKAHTARLEGQITTLTDQVATLTQTVSRLERETIKRPRRSSAQRADEASFVAAGFAPVTAAKLVKRLNQISLDEMYLRDQAVRESWMGTERYREAQADLQQQREDFRAELSDEEYGRFLYATGRPNRVTVESVMGESQAEWIGLQPGDRIVRYAGEPIHRFADLRQASTAGEAGALVPVQVERNGKILELSIERGPLGVRLGADSVKP